jgi:hypothetical protein
LQVSIGHVDQTLAVLRPGAVVADVSLDEFEFQFLVGGVVDLDQVSVDEWSDDAFILRLGKLIEPILVFVVGVHAVVFLGKIENDIVLKSVYLAARLLFFLLETGRFPIDELEIFKPLLVTAVKLLVKLAEELLLLSLDRQLLTLHDVVPGFLSFEQVLILVFISLCDGLVVHGYVHVFNAGQWLDARPGIVKLVAHLGDPTRKLTHTLSPSSIQQLIVADLKVGDGALIRHDVDVLLASFLILVVQLHCLIIEESTNVLRENLSNHLIRSV